MGTEQIALYNTLFYACLALAVLGLAAAVFFFLYFNIPMVYRFKFGKVREKDMEKLRGGSSDSGQLRRSKAAAIIQSHGEMTGDLTESAPMVITEQIKSTEQQETTVLSDAAETTILAAEETTVLKNSGSVAEISDEDTCGETAVLAGNRPGTAQIPAGLNFQIIEHKLMIHTNELI